MKNNIEEKRLKYVSCNSMKIFVVLLDLFYLKFLGCCHFPL